MMFGKYKRNGNAAHRRCLRRGADIRWFDYAETSCSGDLIAPPSHRF